MDRTLQDRIYSFLAGTEGKKDKTLKAMMRRWPTMEALGFQFEKFLESEVAAQQEGERFILSLRVAGKTPGSIQNHVKQLKALARMQRFREADWKLPKQAAPQPSVYTLTELRTLLRLPFRETERRRLQRALVVAHLALGWRLGELRLLEETHLDPVTHTVFLAHPEKGNPQRRLPIEEEFFRENRAFMSWLRHRPVHPQNSRWVWTYTDRWGRVKLCTEQKLALFLADAGEEAGRVNANCTRGRHTRCAALLAQNKSLAFVRFFMGHSGIATLTHYIEMIAAGLAKHLARTTWFTTAQGGTDQ